MRQTLSPLWMRPTYVRYREGPANVLVTTPTPTATNPTTLPPTTVTVKSSLPPAFILTARLHPPLRTLSKASRQKTKRPASTGPIAVNASNVTIIFTKEFKDGEIIDSRNIITFTVGIDGVEIDGLHIGVKGMSLGGKRRLFASAAHAFTREESQGFIGESVADFEVAFELKLLRLEGSMFEAGSRPGMLR